MSGSIQLVVIGNNIHELIQDSSEHGFWQCANLLVDYFST